MPRIAVVDYGRGNVHSVIKALRHIGARAELVGEPAQLGRYDCAVLPGVGAFPDAMARLNESAMAGPVVAFAAGGRPLLGICLGMQVLLSSGKEGRPTGGLGLVPGSVDGLHGRGQGLKVPHVGFNSVHWKNHCALTRGIPSGTYYYFVHSYAAFPSSEADWIGTTLYGARFASVIGRGNVFGTQFHPEKSGEAGLALLENFASLGDCRT
jgi:glutamine amidotransferase